MKRAIVFWLIRFTMLPMLIRETYQRRRVTIIFYHDPPLDTFRAHLGALRRVYNVVPLRRFIDAHAGRKTHELPPKALVITLDDGHAGNYKLLRLLEEFEVPVTIFLCSDIVRDRGQFWFKHVAAEAETLKHQPDAARLKRLQKAGFGGDIGDHEGEALSRQEIMELAPLVDFQSHTASHPVLTYCSGEKSREEIFRSKHDLEHDYGFDIYALSYPNGDYSNREIALAKAAGYRCALTAEPGFNSHATNLFRLKRISIDDTDGVTELLVKASGLWGHVKALFRPRTFGYIPSPPGDVREP